MLAPRPRRRTAAPGRRPPPRAPRRAPRAPRLACAIASSAANSASGSAAIIGPSLPKVPSSGGVLCLTMMGRGAWGLWKAAARGAVKEMRRMDSLMLRATSAC